MKNRTSLSLWAGCGETEGSRTSLSLWPGETEGSRTSLSLWPGETEGSRTSLSLWPGETEGLTSSSSSRSSSSPPPGRRSSMSCSPGSGTDAPPLLQLPEVGSSKAAGGREEGGVGGGGSSSPELLVTPLYSPPLGGGRESHTTVCIPSPYTDSSLEYGHGGHGALAFYSPPSLLGYSSRPPSVSDSPSSSICAPLSPPSLFWPPHHGHHHHHHNMPSLTLHCPQPLGYDGPWAQPHKPHGPHGPNSTTLISAKLGKRQEDGEERVNSSSSSSSSSSAGGVGGAKADMHFCAVCHDYASGYHYGVWSCEGCKAFFKRSIQGHNDYICPATNQCTIDKNRRKSCQACRLRKCYEVGMMKCGVRRERCSYRGARHRRVPQVRDAPAGMLGGGGRSQRRLGAGGLVPQGGGVDLHHTAMTPEQLISRIMEAEPPDIYLMEELQKPFTEASMMMSLTSLADKELVVMISWAKKVPGFVELSLGDQVHLLECCWLEVLMLGLMWRSVDHPGKLIFSPDFKLNRDEGNCVEGILEIFDMLLAATSRFRELKLQREEYVCLKAMILLNSNMCNSSPETPEELESRGKLLRLLDSVTDALVWAISRRGLSFQQQSARLAHLLMLLSHIRHVSNKGMDHLSNMKKKNVVLVYDLLLEMLDANTTSAAHSRMSAAAPRSNPFPPPAGTAPAPHHASPAAPQPQALLLSLNAEVDLSCGQP